VQRLFSAFPGGFPGSGLLLLRVVAGTIVALSGGMAIGDAVARLDPIAAVDALAVVSGAALVVGLMTPVAAVCVAAIVLSASSGLLGGAMLPDRFAASLLGADAIAIALIGPGRLSVDARLFAPREVFIPRDRRSPRP